MMRVENTRIMQVQSDKGPTIILHPDPPLCATKSHTVEPPITDTPYNRQPLTLYVPTTYKCIQIDLCTSLLYWSQSVC